MKAEGRMKIKTLLIVLLALTTAAVGADSRWTFSIKGSYYVPVSSTFNKEYVPAVNENLKQLSTFLSNSGLSGLSQNLGEITGIISAGGELEFRTGPQFYLVLGSEFVYKRLTSGLKVSGVVQTITIEVTQDGKVALSSIPAYLTFRVNIPVPNFRLYIGGGLGYYYNRAVITEKWEWKENLVKISEGSRKVVATARNIFPHANVGADLEVSSRFYLSGDIRVPIGSVKNFKIKSDSLDSSTVGQKLAFIDKDGQEKDFDWELTGPSISVSLKYKF